MFIKNTPVASEILMATDDQIGHIKGFSDKSLRLLDRQQAKAIIKQGGVYNRAYDEMLRKVLVDLTGIFVVVAKVVNYDLSPTEIIRATGRTEHLVDSVVATMPRLFTGIQYDVPAVLFETCKRRNAEEFEQDFERHGLISDPYLQAAINAENRKLADEYPNGTQWNRDGEIASFLTFCLHFDRKRAVVCNRSDRGWRGRWFGVGRRKS